MSWFDAAQRAELMAIAAQNRRALDANPGPEDPWMCQQCDGGGEIAWNPSHIGDPQCVETATCPRCDGSGAEPDEQATTEEEHDGR
jgi:DnaJ-class molecular chaperone